MPNGGRQAEYSLDGASESFRSFERSLARRTARTTRSREDANAVSALFETWFRTYRPRIAAVLGEFAAVEVIDRQLREIRSRVGTQIQIADLRRDLRAIARTIDREVVPAYEASRWTDAAAQPVDAAPGSLVIRLERLSPDLAASYGQVQADMADPDRATYLGPAGEIREVLRASIHLLAPDEEVQAQSWYVGAEGRPMQAERIRYVVQQRSEGEASPVEAADIVETKVGRLGRGLYSRASRAFHVGTQREELDRIVRYVDAVLNEILPL
jgi:hypothetical protein